MIRMARSQRGLTMVELLVAVALSTVIALAAVAALVVSRRGFTTVDAASELRDNARFASGMIQRIVGQAGYLDWQYAMLNRDTTNMVDPPPSITGFNNAFLPVPSPFNAATNPLANAVNESRGTVCNTNAGSGCSDILVVRYQAQSVPGAVPAGSAPLSDQTMIDCSGRPMAEGPATRDDQGISVFHVALYKNEPTLMCSFGQQRLVAGALVHTWAEAIPVISGVENFQVLYGTDGVVPSAAPTASSADTVPNRYLRADQLVVSANLPATHQNWRRVRSIRVGMILRGPMGSAQEFGSTQVVYPFGQGRSSSSSTTEGQAMSSTADRGSRFTPPADSRIRQTTTFTVYLHNAQGLCLGPTCTVQ